MRGLLLQLIRKDYAYVSFIISKHVLHESTCFSKSTNAWSRNQLKQLVPTNGITLSFRRSRVQELYEGRLKLIQYLDHVHFVMLPREFEILSLVPKRRFHRFFRVDHYTLLHMIDVLRIALE